MRLGVFLNLWSITYTIYPQQAQSLPALRAMLSFVSKIPLPFVPFFQRLLKGAINSTMSHQKPSFLRKLGIDPTIVEMRSRFKFCSQHLNFEYCQIKY